MKRAARPSPVRRALVRPRAKGARSAHNRARALGEGHDLPAHREAILQLTGRLLVHFENASNIVYHLSEVKPDNEPRALLREVRELSELVVGNLKYLFPDGQAGEDVFSKYQGERP